VRIQPYYLFTVIALTFIYNCVNAQAPIITYNTPVNVYTVGTAITNLVPENTGGAVPATTYAQVTTLVASGTGTPALSNPQAITTDASGNIYVADYGNNLIRKITSAGVMSTLAGSGAASELNGTGTAAKFNGPDGIAFDGSANLYVADAGGNTIRKIVIATGVVTTYAGSGTAGAANNATLLTSTFNGPAGLSVDGSGNMYIADQGNNLIREISGTTVSTLAGSGTAGSTNGTGIAASFNQPNDLVADGSGNVYVADYGSNLVRKIVVSTKAVTTFAGSGTAAYLNGTGTAADASGNIVVADLSNYRIRLISPAQVVTTIAGSGTAAETNGTGTAAAFENSGGIHADGLGNCYVVDYPTTTTGTVRQILLTGYTISPALPAGLTFTGTTGTISGTPTATSAATNYTITGFNSSGSSSTSISIAIGTSVAWTAGSSTTAWATGGNWSTGATPGVNDAVSIGVSAYTHAFEPSITTSSVTVGSITFGSVHAGTLTVGTGETLTIGGNLTVNTGATPTLTGTGTGAVNIAPGAVVNINGTGVLKITSPLSFTLMSSAAGSASVGQITSTSITGTGASSINVQRYLTGGLGYRGYRLLSSPVYAATVSPNNIYSINYLQNSVWLTGAASGGFDKTSNPTLYLFREDQAPSNTSFTNGNFWGISAINNTPAYNYYLNGGSTAYNIPVGNGYMMFFRGNKASAAVGTETLTSYTTPVTVTLSTSGTLNTGQIIVHDWYTPSSANLGWTNATANTTVRGYNLVGNPYASSIDWEQYNTTSTTTGIYANNVGNTIYELNPATNNYDSYQVGGAYTNNGSRTIVSGQGFYVIAANNSSPQLIFNESAKTTTQNTGLNLFMATKADVALVTNASPDQHLRLQLAADSIQTDDVYIGFDAMANTQYNLNEDAPYKPGTGEVSLASISSDNVALAINKVPLPKQNQLTIPLYVSARAYGAYKLNMLELKGVPKLYQVWLMDRFKKDSLDMRHNTTYAFDITTDTNSYGSNRFQLVIRQDPALGIHLLNFAANKATGGAQIAWKAENEENYTNFTVERSTNGGITYTVLDGFASSDLGTYSYLDKAPPVAADMYRLKIEDLNGAINYSNVGTLMYANAGSVVKNNISIYPNPAKSTLNLTINPAFNSNLELQTTNGPNSTINNIVYSIKIVNNTGSVLQTATTTQQNWQTDISKFLPGTYILQVINNKDNSIVGKGTFIKL